MQAVILAAGMGKRLGKLTEDNTKCMIKVNNTTLIERMLQQIIKFGIKKIIIVVGYKANKLKEFISKLNLNCDIVYVENSIFNTTNNIYSLYLARHLLLENDTILFESDLIFEDNLLKRLLNNPYPNLALVAKFESWMDGTVVKISEDGTIHNFISKNSFVYEDIPSYYKTVNIYKFSKEFSKTRYVPFLEAYCKALGNNEYYEQVLKVIALLEKPDLKALDIEMDAWYEIDDIQDLDIAESIFDTDENRLTKIQNRYGGYWRYPKLLDFCYLVNPYFPTEELLSEIKANFEKLITQYPSGLKVNNLLAGKCFNINPDYVCVGNGATELINSLSDIITGKIGIVFPTFEEYPNRISKDQIVEYIPKNIDFKYTASDLISFYTNTKLSWLLLVNPDNPSGNFIKKDEIYKILEWTQEHSINLILDESFIDFSDNFEENSLLNATTLEFYPNLIIIKSISKSYGVPGLRLGIAASSNQKYMEQLKKEVSIWNINSFAEFYLQVYGKYENDYKEACRTFVSERNRFYNELKKIPFIRVIPSSANYFLCEVLPPKNARELTKVLLNKFNILVKDCSTKKGIDKKQYVRIAVKNSHENNYLLNVLNNL